MRIGLTCTTIEPAITHGHIDGIGTYTKNLYETLISLGQNVIPYSFPNTQRSITSAFPQGKFFPWSYSTSTLASLILPSRFYSNLKKHIDILHVTDHMLPKVHNLPVVATICDALMFNNENWHWDTIKLGNLKKWLRKKTLHWADHYITISHAMVPELVEYIGIPEKKISVVYLGVQKEWFEKAHDTQKQAVLKKFNLPPNFLLFTGTLQHKKNLPRLVKAYLKLPSDIQDAFPLIIVGRPGWGTHESLAAIQQLTDAKKGFWLKYVDIDDLRVLFQCASLYVHPSLHEGFGLTLLEAFASETPVLTSNVKALPEVAGGAAYLVDPYSVSDISKGIENVLTSSTLREELVWKGKDRVKEFSWEKCMEETLNIYNRVIV